MGRKMIDKCYISSLPKHQFQPKSMTPSVTTNDLKSIINEIETQQKKPLSEQLNDFKIAGAKLIQSLDKLIAELTTTKENSLSQLEEELLIRSYMKEVK